MAHEFHVRMIRAVIAPSRVPELGASVVRGVPLANAYPVDVFVHFEEAIDEDVATFIEASGGRIINRFDSFATIAAVVPDAVIPAVRSRRSVAEVAGVPFGCVEQPSVKSPLRAGGGSPLGRLGSSRSSH